MARGRVVPANKGKRYHPDPLTAEEVWALIQTCSPRSPTGIRNRALIIVLWRGGLRISEALGLEPRDLDREHCTVAVRGRGAGQRVVALDQEAFAVVVQWLDQRRAHGLDSQHPVFSTLAGQPIKPPYVRALLKRLRERAGIAKRVHPHGLRLTRAAELASAGVPTIKVQTFLGHSNLSTTMAYLRHIAPLSAADSTDAQSTSLNNQPDNYAGRRSADVGASLTCNSKRENALGKPPSSYRGKRKTLQDVVTAVNRRVLEKVSRDHAFVNQLMLMATLYVLRGEEIDVRLIQQDLGDDPRGKNLEGAFLIVEALIDEIAAHLQPPRGRRPLATPIVQKNAVVIASYFDGLRDAHRTNNAEKWLLLEPVLEQALQHEFKIHWLADGGMTYTPYQALGAPDSNDPRWLAAIDEKKKELERLSFKASIETILLRDNKARFGLNYRTLMQTARQGRAIRERRR